MATCAKCGTHFFQLCEDAGPLCPRCLATEVSLQPLRVTPILVGLIVVIYVAMVANGVSFSDPTTDALLAWGADFGPLALRGQSWRLLTSMFLHAGFLHLAFNAWALWVLGRLTERLLGSVAFTLLYLLSGIGGNLLSLLINPLQVSVGASGAIFGAAGALVTLQYVRKLPAASQALPHVVTRGLAEARAHYSLGAALLEVRRFDQAIASLRTASRLDSLNTAFANELGIAYLRNDQLDSAIVLFKRTAGLAPRRSYGHANVGLAYLRAGRAVEAITPLRTAVDVDPNDANAQFLLGNAYLATQAFAPAVASFDAALPHAKDSARVYLRRGVAYRLMQRQADARADFEHAVSFGTRVAADSEVVADARRGLAELGPATRGNEVFLDAFVDVKPAVVRAVLERVLRELGNGVEERLRWRSLVFGR